MKNPSVAAGASRHHPFRRHHRRGDGGEGKVEYILGAGIVVWAAWQLAVLGGILIGAGVPAAWRLEFAAPLGLRYVPAAVLTAIWGPRSAGAK